MVGRFVAFQKADLNVVEAVAMIQIDQAAAGFLDRIRIDRAADFEIGFLGELLGAQAVIAQVFDIADDRPLDDFENYNPAARRLARTRAAHRRTSRGRPACGRRAAREPDRKADRCAFGVD